MSNLPLFQNSRDLLEYPAGSVIFNEGDAGDVMYVVVEGEVEIRNREFLIEVVSAGGIIGELALVDQGPRTASAVARQDAKLALLDQKRFTFMIQNTPFFALNVMKIMVDRLRKERKTRIDLQNTPDSES